VNVSTQWIKFSSFEDNTLDDPVTLNMGLVLQALIRWFIFTIQCPFSFLYLQYCVLNVWVICSFMWINNLSTHPLL